MWAFDLIELNGDDLRRHPLAMRKFRAISTVMRHAISASSADGHI